MSDITTKTCRICFKEIKQGPEFQLLYNNIKLEFPLEYDVTITENPVACSKCKNEFDNVHQLGTQLQPPNISSLIKDEIKAGTTGDEIIKSENIVEDECVLFNTDIPLYVEESISVKKYEEFGQFLCKVCTFDAQSEDGLKLHSLTHNNVPVTNRKHFNHISKNNYRICCNGQIAKAVSSQHTTTNSQHFIQHSSKKSFFCNNCDYNTNSKRSLKVHMIRHSGVKRFSCDKCDYTTDCKPRLQVHMMKHSSLKRFICDKCDFKTKFKSDLKVHMMKHSGVKRFSCDKCDYKTNFKSALKGHIVKHSGGQRFTCNQCDYRTNFMSDLKRHMMKHSGGKRFNCDKCNYKSNYKSALEGHIVKHSGGQRYTCNKCDYKTNFMFDLKRHMMKHSGEQLFSCDNCDYKCNFKSNLNVHMKKHLGGRTF